MIRKRNQTQVALWLFPALLAILWPSPALAGVGITFSKVADTGTLIPTGTGTFTNLARRPSIDDNANVVFCATGGLDLGGKTQEGIYTHIGGILGRVADKNTSIPGGGGATFTGFGGLSGCLADKPSIDDGTVAFQANTITPGTTIGMYTNADGALEQIAIADNLVGSFSGFSPPWLGNGVVAFRGTRVLPNLTSQPEILRFNSASNVLTTVDVTPGCSTCAVAGNVNPSLAGTFVAGGGVGRPA